MVAWFELPPKRQNQGTGLAGQAKAIMAPEGSPKRVKQGAVALPVLVFLETYYKHTTWTLGKLRHSIEIDTHRPPF